MRTSIYDITVRMDVTNLVLHCKKNKKSFFIRFLYLALRELNGIPELRMRIDHGEPILYDKVDASFTALNDYGYFVNRTMEYCSFDLFYEKATSIIERAKEEKNTHP